MGEIANSAMLAMSTTEMKPCENRPIWKGVKIARTARNTIAHTGLRLDNVRTARVIVASETMMQTTILYSAGERNSTAKARVRVASNAATRVKLHAFELFRNQPQHRAIGSAQIAGTGDASRSLNRRRRKVRGVSSRSSVLSIPCLEDILRTHSRFEGKDSLVRCATLARLSGFRGQEWNSIANPAHSA